MLQNDSEPIKIIKSSKLLLNKEANIITCEQIVEKISAENVATFYQLAKYFNLQKLLKICFSYIERCFTMFVESLNFLELEFTFVAKILRSSNLEITSELEVFEGADTWLRYNKIKRSKFAKDLLLKVRLPLLSDHAVNHILQKPSVFNEIDECVIILKKVLESKEYFYPRKFIDFYTNRYCNQKSFNILICGGFNYKFNETSQRIHELDVIDFKNGKDLPSMIERRSDPTAVFLKGEIYVYGGYQRMEYKDSIEKYSPRTKSWKKVSKLQDHRVEFCSCVLIDKIYVIGGREDLENWNALNSCLEYDVKGNEWRETAAMNEARYIAACTVFQGKIVVSGGCFEDFRGLDIILNTVEVYDHVANSWSYMPEMVEGTGHHSLVAIKNKLYAFGWSTLEVFGVLSNIFVSVKLPEKIFNTFRYFGVAIAVEKKIFLFGNKLSVVECYDPDKDEWSTKYSDLTKDFNSCSFVKVPQL